MKKFIAILCLCLCLCADASFAHKSDSITFRLHLKQGDMYALSTEDIGTQSMVIKGISESFTKEFGSDYLVTVDDIKSNGNMVMTLKLLDVIFSIKSKGFQAGMDSRDSSKIYGSTKTAQKEMRITYDGIQKIIGTSFWVELNERAEIVRSNLDTVLIGRKDYERMISGNAQQILSMAVYFPDYPVKKGDSWNEIRAHNNNGKVLSEKLVFTLLSANEKFAKINSSSAGWGDIAGANLNLTFTGEHQVDLESGLSSQSILLTKMESKEGAKSFKSKDNMTITIVKR